MEDSLWLGRSAGGSNDEPFRNHRRPPEHVGESTRPALGGILFSSLKSELPPSEDRGVVFGIVSAPQGSTPQYTSDVVRPIEAFYAQVPEAAAYTAFSGFPTVVDGNAILRLKPW